eukprot:CAMPEP_0198420228 /NCGR_PEP_ID=MMETSP1452-20131203/766_1 /TAXON_ID=1181717 /ORGANISM="Synchroma pusillum, Strain CCMP3072" /LENGTH=233 /DNA_ID=CAMNT_0044140379 /DNA_START=8 /DNA_END=709 /DNA_ORIENTATION=-
MATEYFGNVYFTCVARREGSRAIVVASHSYNTETDLNAVRQVLEQPTLEMNPRSHYAFTTSGMAWHLMADMRGLIYVLITRDQYPQRCAHACLEELERTFVAKAGDRATTAQNRSLDKTTGVLLQKICQKYDDLASVDRLASVTAKVESVKVTMQENVDVALQNCVRLENIERAAEELQQQAGVFKRQAKDLRQKMWWKNLKMKLLLAFIIIAVLTAIIVPIAIFLDNSSKDD